MILLLDNYDSFTYNIVQYLEQLGLEVIVCENDVVSLADIEAYNPQALLLGPGPGTPDDAGITLDCIQYFSDKLPILGVCLGHQAIAQAFGAKIVRAETIMHGRTSRVFHNNETLFKDLPNPTQFTRYHSLIIDKKTMPDTLEITAWTCNSINDNSLTSETTKSYTSDSHDNKHEVDEIMAIRHKQLPIEGVQFHPESILSEAGLRLLHNFVLTHLKA